MISSTILFSQSLTRGDIAFIGYNTDSGPGPSTDHSFSFITLTDIPASEVIFFTEEGWNDDVNAWVGNTEGHLTWIAPVSGLPCGTVIFITESGSDTFSVTGGGTATLVSGSGWNLLGGDQVLAYQSNIPRPATIPNFISGINGNDGDSSSLDSLTLWDEAITILSSPTKSCLPSGLTNGTDCLALFITSLTEQDNAKYTGTLTGTSTILRSLINDRTNWSFNNSTAFDITPTAFSPLVTCSTLSISEINKESQVIIYPNPSRFGNYFIKKPQSITLKSIKIINVLGQVIQNINLNNFPKIDLSKEESGIYFIQIIDDKGDIITERIIKQ